MTTIVVWEYFHCGYCSVSELNKVTKLLNQTRERRILSFECEK